MYRSLGGLQAYPSRAKNPDWFDFSTGSMGLGAVAPGFAALMDRYLQDRFGGAGEAEPGQPPVAAPVRNIAVVGDAELDEGSVWEAWTEEAMADLRGHVVVVDLNRQSLDRVVGDHRSQQLERLFRALGWHVVTLRFGRRLQQEFAEPGGAWLRERLETMGNLEYHALLRLPAAAARKALGEGAPPRYGRAARGAGRRGGRRAARRRGRSRPGRHRGSVRGSGRRDRPAGRHPRVDPEGVAAAVRRRSAEPRGAAHRRAAGRLAPRARGGGAGRVGAVPARQRRGAVHPAPDGAGHRPPATVPSAAGRHDPRPARHAAATDHVDPGGVRRRPRRARPAGRTRLRADHRVRRRHDHDPSFRVGQPARRLRDGRAGRRVRASRAPAAHPLEGVAGRPASRARDRRGVVLRAPVGPGPGPGALRSAALAHRHAVRLLPAAGPGPPATRHLLQGALHPGRQSLRHHASLPRAARTSRS